MSATIPTVASACSSDEQEEQAEEQAEAPKVEEVPWVTAIKKSPPMYANTHAVSFNLTDISICFGSQFDNNQTNLPGTRIVLSHENFMRTVETLLPYYDMMKQWYGENRPSLPRDGDPKTDELIALIKRIMGPKDGS